MKYCSNCGAPVELKIPSGDSRERHVCDQCKTIHYQNPRVIACCIPTHQDQVLLCKRAIEPREGFWTVPGGFLENGETSMQGALRECYEEALATISNPILSALYDIPQINQVYVFYRGELANMNFGAGDESHHTDLFNEQQVPWELLAFPVIELALHNYFEDLKSGSFKVHSGHLEFPWKAIRS